VDVLVVDDDMFVREAVAEILEDEGLEVAQASSGEAALEALGTSDAVAPSVLVVDVHLGRGRMGGVALAIALRGRWPALGIVVISSHQASLGHAGVLACRERRLMKPFPPGMLVRAVRELADHTAGTGGSREAEANQSHSLSPLVETR
jgi:DNA-binding response OmpR family regulator